ncbi:chain length determinant protein [Pontibacter rugosus]|uniref:Chain length determinant protein n=1 Tax=Pontibacter rugosus TaxID=1745966 RepID=A0ABW3SN16_9BACT
MNENKSTQSDEVDLHNLLLAFQRMFKGVGEGIFRVINAIKAYYLLLIISITIGLLISYAMHYTTKPHYTSSMTLMLANIRNEFMENQLDNLTVMIEEDNYSAVAERLDINVETAQQIKEMSFTSLDRDRIEEDSILTGSPFQIQLALYDNTLFGVMEPAIVNYLESNRFFTKQKLIKQRQVSSMISRLKGEIASIDSIKTTVGTPKGPVNGFVYGQPIDPTNLYRESVTMYEHQVELEADLEQLDNVEVITGFTPRLHPSGPILMKYLVTGGFVAFLIGTILALILESKKRNRSAL